MGVLGALVFHKHILFFLPLTFRYSKLAGQKLKDNSTDITDLSDPNRPTKSAEKFSELYDNEWTDAFQVQLDRLKKSEKEAIQFLLQVLEVCMIPAFSPFPTLFSRAPQGMLKL